MAEDALELFEISTEHATRELFKDMSIAPDRHLDETEEHDVRPLTYDDRYRLAMRMPRRIT
eukprot:2296816-Alexandrium_andersonii.AAC.1